MKYNMKYYTTTHRTLLTLVIEIRNASLTDKEAKTRK